MPLQPGQVTIGTVTVEVRPFAWPVAVVRTAVHVTATGRLVEVDATPRVQDVDLELVGDERTGWATMSDSVRAALEAQYAAAAPVTITDWRGNTGTFMYAAPPAFDFAAMDEAGVAYWTFRLRFVRVS
jgi:hypothetical protein